MCIGESPNVNIELGVCGKIQWFLVSKLVRRQTHVAEGTYLEREEYREQLNMFGEIFAIRSGWVLIPTLSYKTASKYPASPCMSPAWGIWNVKQQERLLWVLVNGRPIKNVNHQVQLIRGRPTLRVKNNAASWVFKVPAVLDFGTAGRMLVSSVAT